MLGVKALGRFPMAWDTDPIAVETCCCSAPIAFRRGLKDVLRRRMEPVLRCGDRLSEVPSPLRACARVGGQPDGSRQSAVCRVACLEWGRWMGCPPGLPCARHSRALTLETGSAKEAKRCVACYGNHLGCRGVKFPAGGQGDCSTDSVAIRYRWRRRTGTLFDGKPPEAATHGRARGKPTEPKP